jgi:hypothetical protein
MATWAVAVGLERLGASAGFFPVALLPVVAYGYVANRWWTVAMPTVWGALLLGVLRLIDLKTGGCHVCGEDEDWSNYPYVFAFTAVVPATFCVVVGVGMRRARDHHQRVRRSEANA